MRALVVVAVAPSFRRVARNTSLRAVVDGVTAAATGAIAGAVKVLETIHVVQRSRVAGERMDRVRIDLTSQQSLGMDVSEYEEMRDMAREGLEVLSDAPLERRAALLEMSAFAEFLVEQMPKLRQEWEARRQALVASGDLPEERPGQRRHP